MANFDTEIVTESDIVAWSPNKDVSVTLSEILQSLELVASSQDIESIDEISTAKFNIMLYNVGCRLIKPSRLYYTIYNNKPKVDYNCIKVLASIYVYICFVYNKGISLRGFSNMLGISLIQGNMDSELCAGMENCLTKIQNFLKKADNELQMSNARDSKQSILQLAYNNYVHGWNGDIKANEIKSSYKSLDDIRRERLEMSANDGQ